MNAFDLVIVIAFVPALVNGISKGLVRQVASLVAIVLSVWLASRFTSVLSEWLRTSLSVSDGLLDIISFVLILIAVAIAVNALAGIVVKLIKVVMLGWLDKLLGIAFAVLKAALVVGLLLILFNALNDSLKLVPQEVLDSSLLYAPLNEFANAIFPYLRGLFGQGTEAADIPA